MEGKLEMYRGKIQTKGSTNQEACLKYSMRFDTIITGQLNKRELRQYQNEA